MKKLSFLIMAIFTGVFILNSCKEETPTDLAKTKFIPLPVMVEATGAAFKINNKTIIYAGKGTETTARLLAEQLKGSTGVMPEVVSAQSAPRKGIYLDDNGKTDESYELTITKKLVTISGSPSGCFFGVQTLMQALSVKEGENKTQYYFATGVVTDKPYYEHRGAMLDVSRHFFSTEEVKQFIDLLAMFKMNVLHLHLSDDQGWRIEIKSWPNLTAHGGSTEVGGGKGGFYTQAQFKELIQYAADRQITIIPEIDMPGHTNAALSSYAELNCNGKATELYTGTRVGFSSLCTDKEITYKFVSDVIREISEITPAQYFHIGGDESLSTPHDDYITFIEKVQQIVKSNGKKVIGWDEIANSNLIDGTIIQFWVNEKNTTMGIEKGAKVIMSPAKKAYMDMKYDSTTVLGLNWAAYIEVDAAYNWDPENYSNAIKHENIFGIEAPLWSETVTNIDEVEFMVIPRLPGYAEIGWTAPGKRNWDEYKIRLASFSKLFEKMGINYYKSPLVPWEE